MQPKLLVLLEISTLGNASELLKALDQRKMCPGNSNEKYHPLHISHKGVFKDLNQLLNSFNIVTIMLGSVVASCIED